MSWKIEPVEGVTVVTMNSNAVNKMNARFFEEFEETMDELDRRDPHRPLVLTAEGSIFSAGLDFEDVYPRFERGDLEEVWGWFKTFRGALLRLILTPRRTVAAINGTALAGGLILAICCDTRVGAEGKAKFALNEVSIGIPPPGTLAEIIRHAMGTPAATDAILTGRFYDVPGALSANLLHAAVPAERLLADAIARAGHLSKDCAKAYAAAKKAFLHPLTSRLGMEWDATDRASVEIMISPESRRAMLAAFEKLKRKS